MNQEEEKVARVYNFSAGPAVLPEEVLREAADEMLDYQGSGQSVMEMSHRSKVYDNIIKEAEKDLRELMNIPDNYKVLFLQDGASQFFAEVPMNLMKNKKAAYIITGQWAKKAFNEAKIYGEAVAVAPQRIRHIHIFQIVQILIFQRMQIMYTSVRTTQYMEQSIRHFLILRDIYLYQMFHLVSYQNQLM